MEFLARFDDQTPGAEHSFALRDLETTIVAHQLEGVVPALEAVDAATRRGRWAGGFVAYDAAPAFDPALVVRETTAGSPFADLPLVWFGVFAGRGPADELEPRGVATSPYHVSSWVAEIDQADHRAAIEQIRDHIADGDTYQVNHTFRLRAAFSGDPYELYRDLALAQRGAYSAWFDLGRYAVLSASPERFFTIDGEEIAVKPMKGTAPRGRWPAEDDALAAELVTSEKERAENLMIVDLVCNDLGRIARFGSVTVEDLFALERYETLWQLTSTVKARLQPGTGLVDVFGALFPSGSVTGAPKARTMEIIRDLEGSPRGIYCGALGFVGPPEAGGIAEFSVGIRTVVIDREEGVARYGTGGGITWESDAGAEFEEARLKARLLVERRPEFQLLEALHWAPESGYLFLEEHLRRLARSATYFGFELDKQLVVETLEKRTSALATPHKVRLELARTGTVTTEAEPLDAGFVASPPGEAIVRLAFAEDPVDSTDVFLFHKTSRRRTYGKRLAAAGDVDDAILLNESGEATETTTCNLAVLADGLWWTPQLQSGCLPGVFREVLLAEGRIHERAMDRPFVEGADAIAVINSVRGWRQAILV